MFFSKFQPVLFFLFIFIQPPNYKLYQTIEQINQLKISGLFRAMDLECLMPLIANESVNNRYNILESGNTIYILN